MIEFLLSEANRPFAISIGVMLVFGILELMLALGGFGMMGVLDNLVPDDWDLDAGVDMDMDADLDIDADMDVSIDSGGGAGEFLQMVLGFFGVGRVPLLVVIVAFLTSFGLMGYVIQSVVHGVSGLYLPALLASIPAFFGGSFVTCYMARVRITVGATDDGGVNRMPAHPASPMAVAAEKPITISVATVPPNERNSRTMTRFPVTGVIGCRSNFSLCTLIASSALSRSF